MCAADATSDLRVSTEIGILDLLEILLITGRENNMSNYAWVLEVRPGYEEEYKKRHDEIWPEMVEMLSDAGLRNYNIFRHGLTLFGYFETDDLQKSIDHIIKSEVNKKWGEYMSDILKADIDPKTNFPYLLPIQMHLD